MKKMAWWKKIRIGREGHYRSLTNPIFGRLAKVRKLLSQVYQAKK
jgi:hypothetical protein